MIQIAEAAKRFLLTEEQVLRQALAGRISLCVHAPRWAAMRGALDPADGRFVERPEGAVFLHDRWLFVHRPYLQKLIEANEAVAMALWRSKADGPVDLSIAGTNKPAIPRKRLHLWPQDLPKLNAAMNDDAAGRYSGIIKAVRGRYMPVYRSTGKWPLPSETRVFIRNYYANLGIPGKRLSDAAVKRIDSIARPAEIRDQWSQSDNGRS